MRLNLIQRIIRTYFRLYFLLIDTDPHLLYKSESKNIAERKMYRFHQSSTLKMETKSFERSLFKKLRRLMLVFVGYVIVKYLIMTFIQTINLYHTANTNCWTTNFLREFDWLEKNSFVAFYKLMGPILGNPLKFVPGVSIFTYILTIVSMIYYLILLPNSYKLKPFDSVNVRFLLDPMREINRIDMVIKETLHEFLLSIKPIQNDGNSTNNNNLNNLSVRSRYNGYNSARRESIMRQVIFEQLKQVPTLRPAAYSLDCFSLLFLWVILFSIVNFSYSSSSFIAVILIYFDELQYHCSEPKKCQIYDVLSIQDLQALGELFLIFFILWFLINVQVIFVVINQATQLLMAKKINQDLSFCRKILINCSFAMANDQIEQFKLVRQSFIQSRSHYMERNLLRALVKLQLTNADMRKNSLIVSRIIESVVFILGICLIAILVAERLNANEVRLFLNLNALAFWTATNLLLFGCAYVTAQSSKVEKLAWSILAQLCFNHRAAQRHNGLTQLAGARLNPNDLIIKRWRHYVCDHYLSDARNSVQILSRSLTYRTALELNFYIISLVLLLRTHL